MQNLKKRCPRAIAILLSLMMVVVFVPTFAFAAAADITVYVTVSDQGQLAKAKDGSPMANKAVTVKDLDNSGDFTVDEALVAAHDAFYNGGASSGYDNGGGYVDKLWGKEAGFLFFVDDVGLDTGVMDAKVANGACLTAAVLKDSDTWSDWYTAFDVKEKTITYGESVALSLKGHLGMAWMPEDMKDVAIPDATVKDANGNVLGKTDKDGKVSLSFAAAGTYVVTAEGKVKTSNTVYAIPAGQTEDGKYYCGGNVNSEEMTMDYFYTEKDYGDGPYPADEIKTIDMYDWFDLEDEEKANYHLVYASIYVDNEEAYYPVAVEAPTIAPACVITVGKAVQPMKVTAVSKKTFKKKVLKKKKQSFKAIKVSGNQGAVSYSVKYKNKKSKKALQFKNGKVTVKKKTKKGTYKLTVTVKAAGNDNYNAGSIKQTITVKVK